MPIEIWILIFQFLTLPDVCKFRFLSKRANSIYFYIGRKKGLTFLLDNAKKIFDVEEYYKTIKVYFVEQLFCQLKLRLPFSTYLFMRYCLENFLRMTTVSNVLLHLFYCPRSFFAKSDCLLCSRLILKTDVSCKINFSTLSKKDTIISKKDYDFKFFWDNKQQKDIISSDLRRCLNVVVIQDSYDFLLYFLEIQGRYFSNFFHFLLKVSTVSKSEEAYINDLSNELFDNFFFWILRSVKINRLNDLFAEVEVSQFKYLKVINKKYKEYLKKKYEN